MAEAEFSVEVEFSVEAEFSVEDDFPVEAESPFFVNISSSLVMAAFSDTLINLAISIEAPTPSNYQNTTDIQYEIRFVNPFSVLESNTWTNTAKIALLLKSPHRLLEETFISLLQSCKTLTQLRLIHAQLTLRAFSHNDYVTPKLLTAFAHLNLMPHALHVFDQIPNPNFASWNSLLRGYAKNACHEEVVCLFCRMKNMDVMPNCYTFPVVIQCCKKLGRIVEGEEVHCVAMKCGFGGNPFVGTTLIEMYSSAGAVGDAYRVFREMGERNVVAWTAMINGYIVSRDMVSAKRLFDLAPERDVVLWNTMVGGYIEQGDMVKAREVFDRMPRRDVICWNTVMMGYASDGDIEACEDLFEAMPERNVFSWNILMGGYARKGRFVDVLRIFKQMLTQGDVIPNDPTLTTVLSACARLGALELGKWVHLYGENIGYNGNVHVGNALIDMYAKCGVVDSALCVFQNMETKDLITWNTIICGLAAHGCGNDALILFSEMRNCRVKPDKVTFVGILCACTHLGLVEDGMSYFRSMVSDYSIVPQIEQYGCIVDLLGRAGLLEQAMDFIRQMPIKADGVIWTALLGSCRIYKNIELAEFALERLIELEPNNPANYVMLSNIYGHLGRWKDVARLKVAVRDTGYKKFPGVSSIETDHGVFEFCSLDKKHEETEDIYETLEGLTILLKSSGKVPDILELGFGD